MEGHAYRSQFAHIDNKDKLGTTALFLMLWAEGNISLQDDFFS